MNPVKRLFAGLLVYIAAQSIFAAPQILTPEQWLEDLTQLKAAITDMHPRPFQHGDEDAFKSLVVNLERDIPSLSDKEIVVRLAEITGAINDGHTRLSIPRQHPEIGLEFGHSGTPAPAFPELEFAQLPLAFEQFSDGVFVVAAAAGYSEHIGSRVQAVGNHSVADVLERVSKTTFAENTQLESLMGADRLSLPELLAALNIVKSSEEVMVRLESPGGGMGNIHVMPLPRGDIKWISQDSRPGGAMRFENAGEKFWARYLEKENIVYAQINEIADAEESLAGFSTRIVALAEEKDARLIVDLRRNFGGSGGLNRTLELALIQSEALNQYGKSFVLIGRRTFSAAQLLVNILEKYSRVLFVGEPTGARPDHYGDSRKTTLGHSGLTLRVSTLHWSSQYGGDGREYLRPDLLTTWNSQDYFSGSDPAIEAVINFNLDRKGLIKLAFEQDNEYAVARYITDLRRSPDTHDEDFSSALLQIGQELLSEEKRGEAILALKYGQYFFPGNERFSQVLESLQEGPG